MWCDSLKLHINEAEKQCDDQIVVGFDDLEHEHLFTTVWFERASGFAAAGADFWL